MQRRNYLKALSGTGAVALVGGATAVSLSDDASAVPTARLQTETNTETVTGSSPDGSVSDVTANASGTVSWSGFSSAVESVTTELQLDFDGWGMFDSQESTDVSGGSTAFDLSGSLIQDHGGYGPATFSADTDGETKVTTVDLRVLAVVQSAENTAQATDAFTLRTEVTNTQETTDGSGGSTDPTDTATSAPSVIIEASTGGSLSMG